MTDSDSDDFLVALAYGKSDWILDSRSAYHLCRDREMFSTYAACRGLVRMTNNTANIIVGKGTVRFHIADGRSLTLTEVRHVPSLRKKLIFIGMLDSKDCSFAAIGGILKVFKVNKKTMRGRKTRGIYQLDGSV